MKKSTKAALIIGSVLLLLGIVTSVVSFSFLGFDYSKTVNESFETKEFFPGNSFSALNIESVYCDVSIKYSPRAECRIVYTDSSDKSISFEVSDGTLSVTQNYKQKWYDGLGIHFEVAEIIVYLPQKELTSLAVNSLSGDIATSVEISAEEMQIKSVSGELNILSNATKSADFKTTSGDISVSGISPLSLKASSVSGDITLKGCVCNEKITAKTTSGDIDFSNVKVAEFSVESTSGDVDFEECDAKSVNVKTTSGDVDCGFLTEKAVITETVSGNVKIPSSISGGACKIKTTSGDISVQITAH